MRFWKRYWMIIRSFKRDIFITLIWIACATLIGLAAPFANKLVFDLINVWAMPDVGAASSALEALLTWMPRQKTLVWLTLSVLCAKAIAEVCASIAGFFQQRCWYKMSLRMQQEMPIKVLGHLMKLSIGYHIRENTGKQIGLIERGIDACVRLVDLMFMTILPESFAIPVLLCVLFLLDWRIGFLSLFVGSMLALWSIHDFRSITPFRQKMEELYQRSNTISSEALSHIATVQAFGREWHERERMKHALEQIHEHSWAHWGRTMIGGFMREALANVSATFIIAIGLWELSSNMLSLGSLVMLLQINSRFLSACTRASSAWLRSGSDQESVFQLLELLDKKPEVISLPTALRLQYCSGEITFHGVTFSYSTNGAAVRDATFTVNPGEMIALVGPSGSGKSTLVTLLLRAYDVQEGAILLDGQDIRTLELESYRAQLGIVPQVVEIFSVSIRDNIAYGQPDATDQEIESAAVLAGAHEFIKDKPQGYQTVVGQKGMDLSGGERQRIGIARAILRNPRVLIFDEATASLDVISERKIQEALEVLRKGRTTVVIAHRFSTIRSADRIVVMEQGRIIAQGTHEQLKEGSPLYRELERLQNSDVIRN